MAERRFPWLFTALWLAIFLLMLRLGFWQLNRAEEKRELLDHLSESTPLEVTDAASVSKVPRFRTIQVKGEWDSEVAFYLENQFHDGQVGFHVYSVMSFFDGAVFALVNRGWVKQISAAKDPVTARQVWTLLQGDWPRPGVQLGEQTLTDDEKQQVTYLTEDVTKKWLKSRFCGQKNNKDCIILPFIFKLNQLMPDGYERDWKSQMMPPEKHQAYAVQWFTMSLVLFLLYLVFLRKNHAS
ncbi:SURF1 family protein [Marinicella rhabdoformis]|uniref:SURF1 family protein n=1 Tax=Marinicella rhabdoformis TaxID=2580566 RepID=UPI0015CFF0CB|nr:SURF1 family protein [Marinicella rhabdoformis]